MRTRVLALALLCAVLPAMSAAETGILLLAHSGTPEWNAQLTQLAAQVAKQKPAELAHGVGTRADVQSAVDRLVKRGVTEIVAVPLFAPPDSYVAPAEYLQGFSVPIRTSPAAIDHPVIMDIFLSRALEISRNPADEVLVLAGYGATDPQSKTRWTVNLAPAARQLNALQRFAAVVTLGMRTEAPTPTEQQQLQRMFQRHTASGKRILVVAILVAAGASEPSVQPWLEGRPYETAKAGVMPDDRLVEWVLSSAGK